MTRPFRWILFVCAVGLALALAAFGADFGVRAAEDEAVSAWTADLRVTANDRRMSVESWVAGRRAIVRVAAAYPTVVWLASGRPPEPPPFPVDVGPEAHLKRIFDSLCQESEFASAIVVDRAGAILAVGGDPTARDRASPALAALVAPSAPSLAFDADADGCVARFVEPVRSRGGTEVLGALVMREDVRRHLAPALAWGGRSTDSGETFLVDRRDGTMRALASRALDRGFLRAEALAPGVGTLLAEVSIGGARTGESGDEVAERRVAAYSPVGDTSFGVAAAVDRSEAVSGQRTGVVARVAAVALGVVVFLLGALTLRESRRARGEAEGHARDARLVSAIEHTHDVALFVREDGTIVEALGATDRLYGVPAASLVGRRFGDLRAPETGTGAGPDASDGPAQGTVSEETHRRADGTTAPVELSTSPVAGAGGDRWYLALVRDVGERRRAEEATRTLVRAVEQSPVSIVVTDVTGTIAYVNPHFCEVTGYDAVDVRGRNARILKSGQTPADVYADLWRTITAGRVWHGDMVNRRKDGTLFTERASIAPVVDAKGLVSHFVAVKEDLTAWMKLEDRAKASEARFLQAQRLEAVGRLAGGVAHDFNNLLCVILGYGQLAADALGPASPVASHVAQIVKAGHAAEALTRRLLAFSHRQVLETRVLDLNKVVRRVEALLRRLIGEDVTLDTALASEPAVVRADAGQMEQVLMNLAVNARDAMPDGGRLTIRTAFEPGGARWEAASAEVPVGPWVVLSVADTGIGMDAATRARVFEPFFTTKSPGAGTGLGLATVYGIVNQSGGQVAFSSAPGEGTEFRIHLPRLALDAEDEDCAPVDLRGCEGKETVLLAEDQEAVRQIMRLWLERHGYRVVEAADGRAGIELAAARAGDVDLLVTDVMMPHASGRVLANALRVRDPGLPVIYVSGYASDVLAQRGVLEPGVRLLGKPLSEEILLRAVRGALDARPPVGGRGDREAPRG